MTTLFILIIAVTVTYSYDRYKRVTDINERDLKGRKVI